MDQKTNSALVDCYRQISEIWLSTAKIAQAGINWLNKHEDIEFWEAFERRCCIRAGYYARLAEQHRPSTMKTEHIDIMGQVKQTEEIFKTLFKKPRKPKRKQPNAS